MHDKMMEAAMAVGQGNPGALNIVREILNNSDRRQAMEDLQLLKEKQIVGAVLYMAYSDVKKNYLRNLEAQPEGYQNPFSEMTVSDMLGYIRSGDAQYMNHLNKVLEKQGYKRIA
jgi:hypothetical protein